MDSIYTEISSLSLQSSSNLISLDISDDWPKHKNPIGKLPVGLLTLFSKYMMNFLK